MRREFNVLALIKDEERYVYVYDDESRETLLRLHVSLNAASKALFAHCTRTMIDGAYDKTLLWLRNPKFSNRILPPYLGFTDEELAACRRVFDKNYAQIP